MIRSTKSQLNACRENAKVLEATDMPDELNLYG